MKGIDPCCEQIKAALEESDNRILVNADGSVDVLGCCGGQCNSLSDITFCPFCGRRIQLTLGTISRIDGPDQKNS